MDTPEKEQTMRSDVEQINDGERKGVQTVFINLAIAIPFIFLILAIS